VYAQKYRFRNGVAEQKSLRSPDLNHLTWNVNSYFLSTPFTNISSKESVENI